MASNFSHGQIRRDTAATSADREIVIFSQVSDRGLRRSEVSTGRTLQLALKAVTTIRLDPLEGVKLRNKVAHLIYAPENRDRDLHCYGNLVAPYGIIGLRFEVRRVIS